MHERAALEAPGAALVFGLIGASQDPTEPLARWRGQMCLLAVFMLAVYAAWMVGRTDRGGRV